MFIEALLAASFQIGPFYEQRTDFSALRPFWSEDRGTTDVIWPIFTAHDDWWRALLIAHYQDYQSRGYQFELDPIWWNGVDTSREEGDYYGLFPIYGTHPHFLLMYDLKFALWPVWHQYKMPRGRDWLETNSILFPIFHWRSDGSWGLWPIYGLNHQRESDHQYVFWPIVTWANYRADRDTSGAGYSWMFWPIWGEVARERESQHLFLPPLFSYADTPTGWRLRCPWPLFEIERRANRDRTLVLPFYEHTELKPYNASASTNSVTRFGWKLVELYDDETRVFPFWVSRSDDAYFRLWPFCEISSEMSEAKCVVKYSRFLSLMPLRWVPAIDRNWSKFWTFYECEEWPHRNFHSLFWGIIRWQTNN